MAGRVRTRPRPAAQRYRLIRTRQCTDAILPANAARAAVRAELCRNEAPRVTNAEPRRYSVWYQNVCRGATRQYEKCGLSASWICRRFASDMPASVGICAGEGDDGGAAVDAAGAVGGGVGCGTAAIGAGLGVGNDGVSCTDCGMAAIGAGGGVVVGSAGCGTAAIGAVGGVGSEAGGPATDGAGAVPPAGTFLTDEGEGCGATDCPLSLRRQ